MCQAAMFYNANLNLIIIGVYRPPRADDLSFKQCLEKIDSFIRSHENADIQMMGDLNMPYMNWQAKEVIKHQLLKSEVSSAHRLLSFMENHMLNQLVTKTTRKDIPCDQKKRGISDLSYS